MEPNETNLKPQPTGGLKLMTVFIAVLALHVVVIGGFTVWHLLYPSGTDADLTLDKTHKNKIVADSTIGDMPADATATDKSATPATTTSPTDGSSPVTTDSSSTPTSSSSASDSTASTADSSTAPTASATASPTTSSVPVIPATTPATPVLTEDASATAANPPATTPASTATAATPVPSDTHPIAAATTPDLAPPADASTASADAAAPAVATGESYTVKRGDSLARIARRHHITLTELRTANNLKSDRLHIAQVLTLPSRAPKAAPADADAEALATPAPAATTSPSSDTETTAPAPVHEHAAHMMASMATTHHAHKLAATHHLYTVVRGDTLTRIAKRYHTTTSALVAANGLPSASRLSIGEKLHIPSHEARTAEDKPIEAEPHGSTRAQLANNLP